MTEQDESDAERYRFIRDVLVQGMDPRMDNTFIFRVRSPQGRVKHSPKLLTT